MSISSCTVLAGKSGGTISTSWAVPTKITGSRSRTGSKPLCGCDGDVHGQRLRTEMQDVAVGRRLRGLRRAGVSAGTPTVYPPPPAGPTFRRASAETMRARVSSVPPAPKATTMRTDLSGQVWAVTAVGAPDMIPTIAAAIDRSLMTHLSPTMPGLFVPCCSEQALRS